MYNPDSQTNFKMFYKAFRFASICKQINGKKTIITANAVKVAVTFQPITQSP